jgi:hypothetical protein
MKAGDNADIPKPEDTAAVIGYLLKSTSSTQKILVSMLSELITTEIKDDTTRPTWENITVRKNEPIFNNSVMIGRAGMVRISICIAARPVKLIAYVNGNGAYLNSMQDLAAECLYVFDVPLNPNDALNLALTFDDSSLSTAVIKFIRLQEIR